MQAIVYTSNAGHAKAYAELLAGKVNLPVYELTKIPKDFSGSVIYISWVMAGAISELPKALESCDVKAVCAVGMMPEESEKMMADLHQKNELSVPLYYLPGGFEIKKLSGMYRMLMGMMTKKLKSELLSKPDKSEKDEQALKLFEQGMNFVDEARLEPLIHDFFSAE